MKPPQQLVELPQLVVFLAAGSEGATKRRGDAGLIGQAVNTDDTPFHVKLSRRLLMRLAGH